MIQSNSATFYYIILTYRRQVSFVGPTLRHFLQGKLKQVTFSAHYIQCRIGSHKSYTTVTILLQQCNYRGVILPVIY